MHVCRERPQNASKLAYVANRTPPRCRGASCDSPHRRVLRHFGAFLGHLCAFSGRLCPKLIVSGCHVRPFSVLDFFGRHPHMGEGVQYLEEGGLQHPQHP